MDASNLQTISFDPSKTIIKQFREITKLSQDKLARILNVSQTYISYLEKRRSKINLKDATRLVKFAAKLHIVIDIDDLIKDFF